MEALIIFDSVFGNTLKIAEAIVAGLGHVRAKVAYVKEIESMSAPLPDLIVVGSPTRQFRATPAIMNFLKSLPSNSLKGVQVAAFDTRIDLETIDSKPLKYLVDHGGYAANQIARKLKQRGGMLIRHPEGFLVNGEQGPLKEGEVDRAMNWLIQM